MKLFDSHCHLQLPQFDADRGAVLARMREAEMGAVVVGTDLETSRAALELAKQHEFLWASVGLHPNDVGEWIDQKYFLASQMEELAQDKKVVAIGECGLDYFRSKPDGQKEKFIAQIALAQKVEKTLIIHCRDAHDDVLAVLHEQKPTVPVVIHFFTGSAELAQQYLQLGCYLSFPGPITYTDMYDESIRVTPLDKILAETDSPFAAPVPHRGKRNEPAYVADVVRKIAAVKDISAEAMNAQILLNSERVFGLQ